MARKASGEYVGLCGAPTRIWLELLESPSRFRRDTAMRVLGSLLPEDHIPAVDLVAGLLHVNPVVRNVALETIRRVLGESARARFAEETRERLLRSDVLVEQARLVAQWLRDIKSWRRSKYMAAWTSLHTLGPESAGALPACAEALRSRNVQVQHAAISALGQIGPAAAQLVPDLLKVLNQAPLHTYAIIWAFCHIRAPSAEPALAEILHLDWQSQKTWEAEGYVLSAVMGSVDALAHLGAVSESTIEALRSLVHNDASGVSATEIAAHALGALVRLGVDQATHLNMLCDMASQSDGSASTASLILKDLGEVVSVVAGRIVSMIENDSMVLRGLSLAAAAGECEAVREAVRETLARHATDTEPIAWSIREEAALYLAERSPSPEGSLARLCFDAIRRGVRAGGEEGARAAWALSHFMVGDQECARDVAHWVNRRLKRSGDAFVECGEVGNRKTFPLYLRGFPWGMSIDAERPVCLDFIESLRNLQYAGDEVLQELREASTDPREDVRRAAQSALQSLGALRG